MLIHKNALQVTSKMSLSFNPSGLRLPIPNFFTKTIPSFLLTANRMLVILDNSSSTVMSTMKCELIRVKVINNGSFSTFNRSASKGSSEISNSPSLSRKVTLGTLKVTLN